MKTVEYLVDTSAAFRIFENTKVLATWRSRLTAGLLRMCAVTELEILYSVRSAADRARQEDLIRELFVWAVMPERVFDDAAEIQNDLTGRGTQRSAGVVDLLTAASAKANGLVLLHYDRDFDQIADVTGQKVCWVAEPGTVD